MTGARAPEDNIEVEWQFEVEDLERVRAWLEAQPEHAPLRFALRKDAEQVDSYYDTSDWRLFFAGYSLRRRRRDGAYEVTLKSLARTSDGPISRREINEASEDGTIPAPDGAGGPVSDRVRTIAGRAPLVRLFEVRTRRRSYAVQLGGTGDSDGSNGEAVAQVELDETTVAPQTAPATTFRRVEVEVTGTPSPDIESFVQAMRHANGLTPTTTSKFEAGLQAASLDPNAALEFGPTERDPRAGSLEYAYAYLREQWSAFLRHAPGTRLGEDIEALHQMRVATRRLRATIRVFDAVLPAPFEGYRDELQWVGHELGAVRDLDVQIEGLEKLRAASSWEDAAALRPLIEVIARERDEERVRLLELLDSDRFDALVDALSSVLREGPPADAAAPEVFPYARPVLDRRFARLRRDGRRLRPDSPAAEYHALRIRGKRLRYSLEVFGDLYGRPAQRVTAALKSFQEMLGDHQDAEVGVERLHAIVAVHGRSLPPETLVAVGTLIQRYRQQASTLREAFPDDFARVLNRWRALARVVAQSAARPSRPATREVAPTRTAPPTPKAAPPVEDPLASMPAPVPSEPETPEPPAPEPAPAPGPDAKSAPELQPAPASTFTWQPPIPRPPASPAAGVPDDGGEGGSLSRMRQLFHRE
ncbi:MAG: CHAD domain-containing protein [Dehalococcoidia bacterium]|nr:CHAD domain-containing protein [Dehalococcoidia bacterium]